MLSRFNPKLVALFPLPNVAKMNEWSLPGIFGIILDGSVRSMMSLCSSWKNADDDGTIL